jgi:hypothetical protein
VPVVLVAVIGLNFRYMREWSRCTDVRPNRKNEYPVSCVIGSCVSC